MSRICRTLFALFFLILTYGREPASALDIPPREQWDNNGGYCGELVIQQIGLYYGTYVSQYQARAIVDPAQQVEIWVGYNDNVVLDALRMTYERWDQTQATPQYRNYLVWTKQHIHNLHPVSIAVYYSGGEDTDYDHIVAAVDAQSSDWSSWHGDDTLSFNDGYERTAFTQQFSELYDTRAMSHNGARFDYCVPQDVDYGTAVTGIRDDLGETVPVQLTLDRWNEPNVSQGERAVYLQATVTARSLVPGNSYVLLRYDDYRQVPTSNFLASQYSWSKSFTAAGTTYTYQDQIPSNGVSIYRCVAQSGNDVDGDGLYNSQLTAANNPGGPGGGSAAPLLGTTVCADWNGFLNGMWNIFEQVNLRSEPLGVHTVVYDISGRGRYFADYVIGGGAQFDFIVDDARGRETNSYGKVCSTYSGVSGDLDGRMVYYRQTGGTSGSFDFAFAMPLNPARNGAQFVFYNTFQPSFAVADAGNLAANWITLTNQGSEYASGTLRYYDLEGGEIGNERAALEPGARRDYSAHQFGVNKVGIAAWLPDEASSAFQIRNVRYFYDNPQLTNSFDAAFDLAGTVGTNDLLSAPVFTNSSQISVLELGNVSSERTDVAVKVYDEDGTEHSSFTVTLAPRSVRHLIMNEILGEDRRGVVTAKGNTSGSVIAEVMQYKHASDGGLAWLYGVPGRTAAGAVLRGSYNTYIGQKSKIVIVNPTGQAQITGLTFKRNNGQSVSLGSVIPDWLEVPAHGLLVVNVTDIVGADDYGVVTAVLANNSSLIGWVMRSKRNDYLVPTLLR